jgi:DNA-binding Xre family transcriptional regulator
MIRWRIRDLMEARHTATGEKMTYEKISQATGISPNTLSALATGKAKQVGIETTIERLLDFFGCEPNDLIIKINNQS